MKTIKILHLYADILDLYGDSGNMEILQYRCKMRNISCEIEHYSIGDDTPDFCSYDLIYIGGGADLEQQHIADDLLRCKSGLENACKSGVFFFLICGGYQLMGRFYRDADGNEIPGLGLFDYFTIAPNSRKKRCIGNIVLTTNITGKPVDIVGFENHGGQTQAVSTPFGEVRYGNGNCFQGSSEGYFQKNVIATYLHGPMLAKNPEISDYILSYCLMRKGIEEPLELLDDSLEIKCRDTMIERLIKE